MTTTPESPTIDEMFDRFENTPARLRAFCALYEGLHTRGRTHDEIAGILENHDPILLGSYHEPNLDKVAELVEHYAPIAWVADQTRDGHTDAVLTAVAVTEAGLTGDAAALGLLPETGARSAAVHGAQAALLGMALQILAPGRERHFLGVLRHVFVLADTDQPTDTEGNDQ